MTTAAGRAVTGAPPCLASSLSSPGTSGCTYSPSQKNFKGKKLWSIQVCHNLLIPDCYSRGGAGGEACVLFPCFPRTAPVLASAARSCARKSCCPSTWSPGRRTPSCPACVLSSASPSAGPRSPPLSRWSAELEEISNPHLSLIKSLTETSSSLFRSGSSSLKTEKKTKLSYISCG